MTCTSMGHAPGSVSMQASALERHHHRLSHQVRPDAEHKESLVASGQFEAQLRPAYHERPLKRRPQRPMPKSQHRDVRDLATRFH